MNYKIKYSLLFVLIISNAFAQSTAVEYKDREQVLSGIAVKPQNAVKNKAGVLILPAWMIPIILPELLFKCYPVCGLISSHKVFSYASFPLRVVASRCVYACHTRCRAGGRKRPCL